MIQEFNFKAKGRNESPQITGRTLKSERYQTYLNNQETIEFMQNAVAESFFKSLKCELIYGNKLISAQQMELEIFE